MIHNLWATPLEHSKFEIDGLADHILSSYDLSAPPSDFNYNIFNDKSKPLNALKEVALANFKKYVNRNFGVDIDRYDCLLKGWITGHGESYKMASHNHSGAAFSSVYYVLAEEDDKGGELHLMDSRANANRGYDSNFQHHFKPFSIQPETNDFVIFPSFVYHHVSEYHSRFRLAIPIDLYLFED